MVGCGLGDAAGSEVDVGGTVAGDEVSTGVAETCGDGVNVDVGAQAMTKMAARISTMIRLQGLAIVQLYSLHLFLLRVQLLPG